VSVDVVCLVGLRCSGKTTVGQELAERLGRRFVDLDEVLVERWNRNAAAPVDGPGELLASQGEATFRRVEAEALTALLQAPGPMVLATGGGCVETEACRTALWAAIAQHTVRVFWLLAPVEVLAARLRSDPTVRPSLTGFHPADELPVLAARRGEYYKALSDGILDATQPVEVLVDELAERLVTDR